MPGVLISLDFLKFSDIDIFMKKIIFLYILTLLATFSQAAEQTTEQDNSGETQSQPATNETAAAEPIKRALPDSKKITATDMRMQLSNSLTQVIELNALDEDFDIYLLSSEEKEPIGSILFFPDERNHSDWPVTLHPLRTKLTSHNWQTAVITLPSTQLAAIPARTDYSALTPENEESEDTQAATDNETTNNETTNNETTDNQTTDSETIAPDTPDDTQALTQADEEPDITTNPMAETVIARAKATITKLKEQSDVIIFIGIGQGATWAAAYTATLDESERENSKLILINPLQSQDISSPKLNDIISNIKIDVIDIYTPQKTSNFYADQADARKRAANRADIEQYLQIKAPSSSWTQAGNQWMYRKVRGILKNNVEKQLAEKEALENAPKPAEKINQPPGATNN